MADLPGWPYWKVISITGQSGAGTDYQVELEIGDSAGGDFHLEGHCTNFPQDITITDNDGTTLLKYKIEDITADPIKMWVKVADDLGSNRDIRVYYGKSGESSNDDEDTFQFFDAFPGSSIDTSKWADDTAHASVSGGILSYAYGSGNKYISGKTLSSSSSMAVRMRGKIPSQYRGYMGLTDGGAYTNYAGVFMLNNVPPYTLIGCCDGSESRVGSNWTVNTYVIWDVKIIGGTSMEVFENGVELTGSPKTTNVPNTNLTPWVYVNNGADYLDWVFVRKYNSPEPTFSSAGAEQTPTVGAIMNQFQRANIGADLYNGVFA